MRRLVGLILICVSIATAFVALVIFGPTTRVLPSPPPQTVGDVTQHYANIEVTPAAFPVLPLLLPLLAVFALGIVLLVLPRSKQRGGSP